MQHETSTLMWIRIHKATFGTTSTVRDHSRTTLSAPDAAVAKEHVRAKKKKDAKSLKEKIQTIARAIFML